MIAPIGLQLYSVREAAQVDFKSTIQKVAEIGYVGVEVAGFPGITVENAVRLFQELNLTIISAHLPAPIGENEKQVLETMDALQCSRLVVPWQPKEGFTTREGIQKICENLNEASLVGNAHGFSVGYHNHWWEAETIIDGKPAYEVMLEYLNDEVFFQVDTYWMQVGGLSAVDVIKKLGKRAPLLHIKDGPGKKDQPMVAAGDGIMDVKAVVGASGGVAEWLIVELDSCATDMMEAVTKSYRYLTQEKLAYGKY